MAAVEALLALRAIAGEGPEIELIAPDPSLSYRPLRVVEPFWLGEMRRFPLDRIAADNAAGFRLGALTSVDPDGHRGRLRSGEWLGYDALVVATGARPRNAVPGALLFHGQGGSDDMAAVLEGARAGRVRSIAFVAPAGPSWPLPLYELALLTAWRLREDGVSGVELAFVTPEREPLELFGASASAQVRALLAQRGVELRTGVAGPAPIGADATVTVPVLEGRRILGLPAGADGFVAVDEHTRAIGLEDVYVVGDAANFPIKHGGLATQEADAAAEAIAATFGWGGPPRPFRPVVRAVLLTGEAPLHLGPSDEPPWAQAGKIVGGYLSAYLGYDRDLTEGS